MKIFTHRNKSFVHTSTNPLYMYKVQVDFLLSPERFLKNLWSRKCVRRVIFWNEKVRIKGDEYGRSVAVRPVRAHLTPKINITFFIRKQMLNIFLFNNFFEKKKKVFSEKTAKNCFRGISNDFLGKGDVLPQKLR